MGQYALVIDGVVNGIADNPRPLSVGSWLPLIEDPATYSPYGDVIPAGFTVTDTQVTRHWQPKPQPPNQAQFDALTDAVTALTLNALGSS